MFHKLRAMLLGLLMLFIASAVSGQTPAPPAGQPPAAPGLRKLTGEDEKRAKQLDEQIDKSVKADRWDEAIARAEELLALRTRVQGAKHFETVDAEWLLKKLRRVAPRPHEDRVAYGAASTMNEQAVALYAQGKYPAAQSLFEKALEVFRRLLSHDHPDTAACYSWLAANLVNQGKYAQAQPLSEKALETLRRLLGDDHPDTAKGYNGLATNLKAQGKYAQAQPLFEKALAINRRLLGDDHPDTAKGRQRCSYQPQGPTEICPGSAAVREGAGNPTIARPWPSSVPMRASPNWTAWPPRASWAGSDSSIWRPTG